MTNQKEENNDIINLSFETALAELEQLTQKLETGDVELENSIKIFERGALLKAHCDKMLKSAQMRVEQIVETQSGISTEKFDQGS